MKKFIALYMVPIAELDHMMKNESPEEMKTWMAEWTTWMKTHEQSFVDPGTPLGKNKRVTKDGVADVRNDLTGYAILQAESHEAAADLLKDNPHLQMPGAYIEVLGLVDMPGV